MGFLKREMNKAVKRSINKALSPKQARQANTPVPTRAPVTFTQTYPTPTQTYRLPAEHDGKVYTYDGAPLKGIPTNTRFVLQSVPGRVEMESVYNGAFASTDDFGDVAYSYNGRIIGFSSSHAQAVKKLMQHGYCVEVEAYISGYDGELGFPYVTGLFGFVDDDLYYNLK